MKRDRSRNRCFLLISSIILLASFLVAPLQAAEPLTPWDEKVKAMAEDCSREIVEQYELLLNSGQLNVAQLFDTFYVPIPKTEPQKYHTRYDELVSGIIRPILDKYLAKDPRLIYVVAVDQNGYLPTHNSRYSQPLTGDPDHDYKWNQSKRLYSNRTGLNAAKNTKPYLVQARYVKERRVVVDMAVPIMVKKRHWGAVRIGYRD
ncbi:MAG: chemotaxis protein [Deltaproteobacteria bacterium]|nr:chemotaxis protein [Deltaproteobacteria bacterium]